MDPAIETQPKRSKHVNRLKIVGAILTLGGIALFIYFVYMVGLNDIYLGVVRFGFAGFAVILFIYFIRVLTRSWAWKLSVHEPYSLRLRDTIPAVVIGEALSNTIPLGILISGSSKAIAVRKHIPLVGGLSSVATENLFYSLITSIFLMLGGVVLLRNFAIDESLVLTVNFLIILVGVLVILGIFMVIRQWHMASASCEWLYKMGLFHSLLERGRSDVRRFEDLIYGFYRLYPKRFLPICLLEAAYFLLGVGEVWYILSRLSDAFPSIINSFLLETVSRFIILLFKLIPFVIGVDEAGAQFIGNMVALAAGVGVTLAIIRKGRIFFWTAVGFILIVKRGLSLREIADAGKI